MRSGARRRAHDRERRRVAQVVGAGLERQPPDAERHALDRSSDELDGLRRHPLELLLVDGDDALQQVEVVARVLGDPHQRPRIFREAVVHHQPVRRDDGVTLGHREASTRCRRTAGARRHDPHPGHAPSRVSRR